VLCPWQHFIFKRTLFTHGLSSYPCSQWGPQDQVLTKRLYHPFESFKHLTCCCTVFLRLFCKMRNSSYVRWLRRVIENISLFFLTTLNRLNNCRSTLNTLDRHL